MSQAQSAPVPAPGAMARLLVLGLVLGVLAAAAGSILIEVIHLGETYFFTDLPATLGLDGTPWWWSAIILLIGATIVVLARRLPGETGEGPLTGFHFDDPVRIVPSVLLAALGTLCFGFVLGPEAPLIVFGTAVGAIVTRRMGPDVQKAAMMLGGVAAIGSIFGNPFIAAFLILEFAVYGLVPAMLLPAVYLALAAGYLTQIGIDGIPGFGVHTLSVPGLPAYDSIVVGDLFFGVVTAILAALVLVIVREAAVRLDRVSHRRPVPLIYVAAALTIAALFIAQVGFGIDFSLILFSGQSAMGDLVTQSSVGIVIVIVLAKGVAYFAALGGGLRGGPIFPATYLGVGVGVLVSLVFTDASVSPMAAAGIAAATAAMIKAPGTSALLGALLIGGSGPAVAPFAIFGAIIGLIIRLVADRRLGVAPQPPATTPEADGVRSSSP